MDVVKKNGQKQPISDTKLSNFIEIVCKGLDYVDKAELTDELKKELFNGITTDGIYKACQLVSKSKIEFEPQYNYIAARCLLLSLYKEVFGKSTKEQDRNVVYKTTFVNNIKKLVENERLSDKLLESYDLDKLAECLKPERDYLFKYIGLQTLYDRYFIHLNEQRMETPQAFFMRVAMGVCINEEKNVRDEWVIRIYDKISQFKFMPSTPTLFNAGTNHPQLSSCFLAVIDDDLESILGSGCHAQGLLSKWAGGLSASVTRIRATNSYIKGTNGPSQGLIPFLKIYNSVTHAINQGSKRSGSQCVDNEPWHLDIEDFIDLRKNTGDDRRRCHDLHTAIDFPDEFFKRLANNDDWYLFSPNETPELYKSYGSKFSENYKNYIEKAKNGELRQFKVIKAKDLWKKVLISLSETGHPWPAFKDAYNTRYANIHQGLVNGSNLCREILLHSHPTKFKRQQITEVGETAVCSLASPNLMAHIKDGVLDKEELADTVSVLIRHLDNVVTNNYYPTVETENSNLKHRPVGMGLMGWHDFLHSQNINFDSKEHLEISGEIQEFISYHAIKTSIGLAKERGKYSTYDGSTWSQNKMPYDTYKDLTLSRGREPEINSKLGMEWIELKKDLAKYGIRNSCLMAIAPNATNSWISGCSPSIEPDFSVLFTYTNLSGNFTVINEWFVNKMKALGLWTKKLLNKIKKSDGDLSTIEEIPSKIKNEFKTAFEINYHSLIAAAGERQKWIDMGQSLNLYYSGNSLRQLSNMYLFAYEQDLKTTYYLRSKGASSAEKTTTDYMSEPVKSCKIDDPDCKSCEG